MKYPMRSVFLYPRYFSTSFKQIKGMTPTRFKEENKKN